MVILSGRFFFVDGVLFKDVRLVQLTKPFCMLDCNLLIGFTRP